MNRFAGHMLLSLPLLLCVEGCAGMGLAVPGIGAEGTSASQIDRSMTQSLMEALFADEVGAIVGPTGAIQTRVDGVIVYLLSDVQNDRMRLIAQVASASDFEGRVFGLLIQANFDRTLDARYGVSDGVIYSVFQHPISSLSPDLIQSALSQVLNLAENFGTSYAAGGPRQIAGPPVDP